MMRGVVIFFALAQVALREVLRQPIVLILSLCGALGILLLPIVTTQTLGQTSQMVTDGALALQFLLGVLLAGMAAFQLIGGDLRRGTASTVLCKPVRREIFLLAKFAGLALVLVLFATLCSLETLLAVRVTADAYALEWGLYVPAMLSIVAALAAAGLSNYFTRRSFPSDAFSALLIGAGVMFVWALVRPAPEGTAGVGAAPFDPNLVRVCVLIGFALLVMGGIATALATRLELVPTVTLCAVMFTLGLMTDYLFGRNKETSFLAAAFYTLLPNWQHFWLADAIHLDQRIPWSYVAHAGFYASAYLSGTLALAIVSFRHREVPS